MYYLIYEVTNNINGKKLVGRFLGRNKNIKKRYSSNKYLLEDIKKYGAKNFSLKIVKEFSNKKELDDEFNYLNNFYKGNSNYYNYSYRLKESGINNIKNGKIKASKRKLNNKFKNFNGSLENYSKHKYRISDYCIHDPIIIPKDVFEKKYNLNIDNLFCEKCIETFLISYIPNFEKDHKILLELTHPKQQEEKYIKFYYPKVYKSIYEWSKKYNNLYFKERLYLFKNRMNKKPSCLCCNNEVSFCFTSKAYNTYCENHKNIHHTSLMENEIYEFIKENYKGLIKQNERNVINKELDIYIPELKLGVEFNGLYWHSEIFKDRYFHYNKWKECKESGIKLITIWEDDWNFKKDIIKSIILNSLKRNEINLNARECKINEVDHKDSKIFLEKNHLQGWCQSSINIGLFYENELVSLMTFGKRNISNKSHFELLRFCNKKFTSVRGGASKLFKYFIDNYHKKDIISYASCDYSLGNIYEKLGFENKGHTGVNYWWANERKFHRSNFMKNKLVKMGYDPNKAEKDIMGERGFFKIYDTGNLLYKYKNGN